MAVRTITTTEPVYVSPQGQFPVPIRDIYHLRRVESAERAAQAAQRSEHILSSTQEAFELNSRKIQAANAGLEALRSKVQIQSRASSTESKKVEKMWGQCQLDSLGWDCLANLAAYGVLATAKTALALCRFRHDVVEQISFLSKLPSLLATKRSCDARDVQPARKPTLLSEKNIPNKVGVQGNNLEASDPVTSKTMSKSVTTQDNPGAPTDLKRVIRLTVSGPASMPLELHVSVPTN